MDPLRREDPIAKWRHENPKPGGGGGGGGSTSFGGGGGNGTVLRISDSPPSDGKGGMEKAKDKKKSLLTVIIDKSDTQMEEDETPEEMWRVVLHNDEVHCWKEQAMKYCLGLQRQGLTASITPESKFEGGGGGVLGGGVNKCSNLRMRIAQSDGQITR
ncbi:hypothetical protein ACHAXA_003562 [Cyclostephanos tholiformis]|uniref:Uncharacterized protein n=1 Tax=Cyclostephanos tholiformis TaxID=382380 RepID=A0ABD3R979_9STRA